MSEQQVPVAVAQRIIIKLLTSENIKPAEILRKLHSSVMTHYRNPRCANDTSSFVKVEGSL